MAHEFTMIHRVEFADTDMAGIIHFSSFFRYMEVTEHAFFRSLGLSVHQEIEGRVYGWPRVHVSCDFKVPVRFEDEVEARLLVREKRSKALTYDFLFRKVNGEPVFEVARGTVTSVCVTWDAQAGKMKAVAIPEVIANRIEAAPPELFINTNERE
jgi:YbgC/YbaW family acyl-CoA thioester hydrolase